MEDPKNPSDSQGSSESSAKRRKSRWGDQEKKVHLAPVQTALPTTLNSTQLEQYLIQVRLEEIAKKLKSGDIVPPEHERSPSPEPLYDSQGKRTNMRESRYKKKLEDERTRLFELAMKNNPSFKPPFDYKKNARVVEKVWIPTREFPDVNFIGLLIGPRGNEKKKIEKESGAKVSIRGKGSVKEGKFRNDPTINVGADEELHAYISADSEDKIKIAVGIINKIIEQAASTPEAENELKQKQLKELAVLNGTFRDGDNEVCTNCGALGHRKYDCPEARNFTINLICKICGGVGHIAKDCINRNNPQILEESKLRHQKMNSEYRNFMAELSGKNSSRASHEDFGHGPPRDGAFDERAFMSDPTTTKSLLNQGYSSYTYPSNNTPYPSNIQPPWAAHQSHNPSMHYTPFFEQPPPPSNSFFDEPAPGPFTTTNPLLPPLPSEPPPPIPTFDEEFYPPLPPELPPLPPSPPPS